MCWEVDYKFFAEQQKKAQDARITQEQRAGVIDRLLNEANKQGEKTEGNLEQYSLSAISALAERAVAALVPR